MRIILKTGAAAPAVALAQACARPRALAPEPAPASMDYSVSAETPGRPDADILTDAKRNPAEVLALFALQPGNTIVDIEADGGYFKEFLSRAVGATGKVYMQNPAGFDAFLGDTVTKRLEGRLANVTCLKSNFGAFAVPMPPSISRPVSRARTRSGACLGRR